jgi:glutathione S-transferase
MRFLKMHADVSDPRRAMTDMITQRGYDALGVMESHLSGAGQGDDSREYFVGHHYSIADVALYAYTHVASEGGFDLSRYLAIRGWLARVKSQPRHTPITQG